MKELTYQEILDQYGMFVYYPVGTSMLPLIREGKDSVKLVKIKLPIRVGEVILYQRKEQFILHRVVKVNLDTVDMVGDHQYTVEKGVPNSALIARMEGVYKEEHYISHESFRMKFYVLWRPMIRYLRALKAKIKHKMRKQS